MLTLSKRHFQVFEKKANEAFLDRAVAHLKAYEPQRASVGDDALRTVAKAAYASALGSGFSMERNILLVAEMMASLGFGFESDSQYYWLHPLYREQKSESENERASRVHWHLVSYLDRVYGEKGEIGRGVLDRVSDFDLGKLAAKSRELGGNGEQLLRWLHPAKADFIGDAALSNLCNEGLMIARKHFLDASPEGVLLTSVLAFEFGHQFYDDPLLPAFRLSQEDVNPQHGPGRIASLESKVRAYVRAMSSSSTKG